MRASLRIVAALIAGLLFGFGLALSGMMDPERVLGFLDIAGHWDPSLAFVLAGAVGMSALGYLIRARLTRPVLAAEFQVPTSRRVDARLLGGSALFGIGWGLAGLCPGPALAALLLGIAPAYVFVGAMLLGMLVYRIAVEGRTALATR